MKKCWLTLVLVLALEIVGRAQQTDPGLKRTAPAMAAEDDVEMVFVPAGEFMMGSSDSEADDDEKPVARVFVAGFWIDKFEVTHVQYRRCVEVGACTRPVGRAYDDPTRANHPVTVISWQQAVAYCRWAGKRLPTEAEWEKAARGTDGRRYPWGNRYEADRVNAGYTDGTTAVGSYPLGASPYGAMDMAGNVWEWTSSLYKPYPYDPNDGREDLNARGARVNRGGSWYYGSKFIRTSHRANTGHIYRRVSDLGFRCAK
ncbi:MAG: formylglycine-generating enzyme family protein [Candidatus Methylomirabilales bacterium]